VGIIRNGRLVDVESVEGLRSKAIRRVELFFDSDIDGSVFEAVPGVRDTRLNQHSIVLSFDGHMDQLLKTATDHYHLVDINSQEADLEEIFLTYYEDEEVPA
jgi:ABC-2 type transport system ATP-binding protein